MKQIYLLGFIRNCTNLPCESVLSAELTTFGTYGVIWCKPPREIFKTKNDFLAAMLQWFEEIQRFRLTVLPIQSGVSVFHEVHLIELLRTYQQALDQCFEKVEGCSEYCLTIAKRNQEFAPAACSSLGENVQSGKEYLEWIRARQQMRETVVHRVQVVISQFRLRLTPWLKDYWADIARNQGGGINLGFLVPNTFQQEFCHELQILLDEANFTDKWTGPWLPFHFSTFSLKPENFLRHESLNWG